VRSHVSVPLHRRPSAQSALIKHESWQRSHLPSLQSEVSWQPNPLLNKPSHFGKASAQTVVLRGSLQQIAGVPLVHFPGWQLPTMVQVPGTQSASLSQASPAFGPPEHLPATSQASFVVQAAPIFPAVH
jgi:hypothetical protein